MRLCDFLTLNEFDYFWVKIYIFSIKIFLVKQFEKRLKSSNFKGKGLISWFNENRVLKLQSKQNFI
jgi:hypothetical protein